LHDIFRRLYYIPIVLGAFSYGIKGGLSASVLASLVYAPHAFTHFFEHDPGATVEKLLEIALYNIVALITGYLAQRERSERLRQEAIADEIPESSPRRMLVEIQEKELNRLGQTLERFLSFARPSGFVVTQIDLRELVKHVVELVEPQARKNAVDVIKEPASEPLFVDGDRDQLTQVLVNLVLNAVDAMPQGGGFI
jgi:signal transduction histidine kinase